MGGFLQHFLFLATLFSVTFLENSFSQIVNEDGHPVTEEDAVAYLNGLETSYSAERNKQMVSRWNYMVNVTTENEKISRHASSAFLHFQSSVQKEINTNYGDWTSFQDKTVRRAFHYLSTWGPANMDSDKVEEMNQLISTMKTSYETVRVCDFSNQRNNCNLRLEPEIQRKLSTVTNYDELAHYWTTWHDVMSNGVNSSIYAKFIELQNEMARANNFKDMSELWLTPFDDGTTGWTATQFKQELLDMWEQLKPVYRKLHGYVRMKLQQDPLYEGKIKKYGYLPANLMGNMWAQDWTALDAKTKPFPNAPTLDATAAMIKAGYTQQKMFEVADKFFQDLGLTNMTQTFWEKSMIVRPEDGREVVCHASAEDFCLGANSTDFRIKMCTNVNAEDLVTVHHEMGHIEYFMQYSDQNFIFRDGANPGFHEAVGDALALAVTTPKHLVCVLGLDLGAQVDCSKTTETNAEVTETDINFLYHMALEKFSFFPFAISMDSWRWGVFDGSIPESEYNKKWWEIREKNQGITPPSPRPDNAFDPSAVHDIVANLPHTGHLVSHILQFQFYEAMCKTAGEYDPDDPGSKPLHQCDFSGSLEAGKLLSGMMKLGSSKPWPEALEVITNNRAMSVTPLLNYFQPLIKVLDKELTDEGESDCFGADCQSVAAAYLSETYESTTSRWCNKAAKADWDYQTDLNNMTAEEASHMANFEYSKYLMKEWTETISQFDYESFDDIDLTKRQLKFLNAVGIPALNDADLEQFNQILSAMTKVYGNGRICPFEKKICDIDAEGLFLDPDLEDIMSQSQNYDELAYIWTGWRNVSGKEIRELYQQYVELSNKAAKLNGYDNMGDFWLLRYESDTFRTEIESIWNTVRPLYDELHAYVRFRLRQTYPQIHPDAPLPAHILGNMWAQSWDNIYSKVIPFEGYPSFDVTEILKQKFTDDFEGVMNMFRVADEFFVSTGLANTSVSYGDRAVIIKPENKSVLCHASAWDMCDNKDYRIKMCTNVDMNDFITIHHELGHIQYDIQYKDLPITLREGANPGFHEAIGDVISLSVANPKHMVKIGFTNDTIQSNESMINYLMKMSLEKVAFLPFGYLIDSYRWKIFDGSISPQNYTYYWLKMRAEYQGVVPPVKRSEQDFDAGAKYHVSTDTPYISYFVSYILQFQLHKVLCETAGEFPWKPLHECDIYKNTAAGLKLKKMLQAGASKNWKELLNEICGNSDLDATALLQYFQPLREYLEEQRSIHNYPLGWDANVDDFYEPA